MSYVNPEQIEQAKQMDLLTYLQTFEPQELVHVAGSVYSTRTHDSLKISNGKWCWWSRSIGGRSALDYLVKVREMGFPEAVEQLTGRVVAAPSTPVFKETTRPKEIELPKACRNNDGVIRYLRGRGISAGLIDYCIRSNRLYESWPYHNAVFVGMDGRGKPRYAALRGINTEFKGEVPGSDKRYSFFIPAGTYSQTVHLFESAIDLLSYATLLRLHYRNWQAEHLLSLAGIYKPGKVPEESKIPVALQEFLEHHPDTHEIVLHLDNDKAGRLATIALKAEMKGKYVVRDMPAPSGKDVNEYLIEWENRSARKKKERDSVR